MANWLVIIGGVLALVGAAAVVVAYFRTNVSKSTIDLYKEDNAALRTRLSTVEKQIEACNKQIEVQQLRIKALEATRNTLLDVVTQATAISTLQLSINLISQKLGIPIDD